MELSNSLVHESELDMRRERGRDGRGTLWRTLTALHWYPSEYRAIGSPRRAIDRDEQEKFPKAFE